MVKPNKKTILTLMICIISLLIIISSSTAAFYYNYKGNKNETVINDAEIRLLESDKKVIKIENALPMSDKQGKTQEETFDFEVRTKTKKEMPLIYNLTLEKKGTKCSNIENPTKEDYPSCYDFELSTSDKNAIINYIVEYGEFPKEEATTYIELQLNKDFDGLVNFYMEVPGAPEEVALEWATHDEEDGYINWVINDYKSNTGNNLESSYVFNKNNYINYELKYCSTIENPTKENNPKCYFTISEEEEMELKNWMKYFFNITYKNPNALYDAILSHDNQGIYDFLITEGWSTNFAKSFISDFEKNNYEEFLISLYEDDTGNTLSVNTEFNGDNKYVYRYLNDHEIKVYIEDYEGNVILEPTLVSELAKNDYILHRKTSNHNMENEEYINKYKLRVWIDEQTDSTYWNEHSNINYEFKIGVATDYQKYQVRYNSNGGNEGLYITSEDYPWTQTEGRYQSGNSYIDNSKSTLTFNSFLITEPTQISFDIAVSAEMNDYAEYTIYKNGIPLEESTKIYGSGIVGGPLKNTHQDIKPSSLTELDKKGRIINTDAIEADLVVRNIRKVLEPGIYKIEVSYVKDSELEAGEDSAYIGNMNFLPWIGKMANSTHIIGQKSNLNINVYEKQYHDFAGWSTTPDGKAIYKDKEEVLNLSKNDGDIIDLYAVWEKKKYEVNLIVQNGIINGESTKQISALENAIFDVIPNNENLMEIIECTNNETAIYENNKLTIENITSNTTCTLKFEEELTTLYEDGTFVINENKNQRTSNITEHGEIIKEYEGLSETQSYVFGPEEISDSEAEEQSLNLETQTTTQPVLWKDEKEQITNVEIGNVILPTSTAYWFQNCTNLSLGDFENLDTSETIDMSSMFQGTGNDATSLELIGLDKFDTSKVENMSFMFSGTGQYSETIKLGNLSSWDTSNVENMEYMFRTFGYYVGSLQFSGIENCFN